MAKQKVAQLAFLMLIAAYSPLLSAQSDALPQSAMSWPMQQGESLNDVARLFYPKNPYMQRQFVAAAIQLNQDTQPDLRANQVFSEESLIVIPDIKVLSKKSRRQAASSARSTQVQRINTVADFAISARLQADYETLMQRNALFKRELEKLNARLLGLQQVFAVLKEDLMRLINAPNPAVSAQPVKTVATQPSAVQAPMGAVSVKPAPVSPDVQSTLAAHRGDSLVAGRDRVSGFYLWVPLLAVLFVLTLFVGLAFYTRKQAEKRKVAASNMPAPASKTAFFETILSVFPSKIVKTQPLTVQSEFSGSISDAEPVKVANEKEDAELTLAQAKIYVNLGRYEDAIKLLNTHIQAAPTAALQHWLYLLDIYRETGQKEAFEACAKQLHHTFNVVMPLWEKISTVDEFFAPAHTLEEYDYIVNKVTKLWADCEKEADKMMQAKNYLDKLLTDTRDHERTGFSMDVFEEIVLLRDMLDAREKLAQEV